MKKNTTSNGQAKSKEKSSTRKHQAARLRATNLKDAQVHVPEEPKPPCKFEHGQQVELLQFNQETKVRTPTGRFGKIVGHEWAGNHREFSVDTWLYYIKVSWQQEWLRILEGDLKDATVDQPA